MKHKIALILSICFSSILIVSLITLSILQTNTKINLPNPDSIKVYKRSTTAAATYDKNSDDYNTILELYNSMFEKTYLQQLSDNDIIDPTINEDTNAGVWKDANFETGIFVEFVFESSKKIVIYRDGSSRRVDITSIIFELTKSKENRQLYVYYKLPATKTNNSSSSSSSTSETANTEPCYPLVTQANTYELYKFIVTKD